MKSQKAYVAFLILIGIVLVMNIYLLFTSYNYTIITVLGQAGVLLSFTLLALAFKRQADRAKKQG